MKKLLLTLGTVAAVAAPVASVVACGSNDETKAPTLKEVTFTSDITWNANSKQYGITNYGSFVYMQYKNAASEEFAWLVPSSQVNGEEATGAFKATIDAFAKGPLTFVGQASKAADVVSTNEENEVLAKAGKAFEVWGIGSEAQFETVMQSNIATGKPTDTEFTAAYNELKPAA